MIRQLALVDPNHNCRLIGPGGPGIARAKTTPPVPRRRGAAEAPVLPDAFETADAAVHVFDEDGIILQTNRSFDLMYGTPPRACLGKHLAALNVGSVAANLQLLGEIRLAAADGGSWKGTFRNRRPDGTTFGTKALVYPMRLGGRRYLVCLQEVDRREEPPGSALRTASCSSPGNSSARSGRS